MGGEAEHIPANYRLFYPGCTQFDFQDHGSISVTSGMYGHLLEPLKPASVSVDLQWMSFRLAQPLRAAGSFRG
jgi:hypothetical protein